MKYKLNLNYEVQFKLTEHGKEIWHERRHNESIAYFIVPELYTALPKVNSTGYSKMQLWRLMFYFGDAHYGPGAEPCFESMSIIVDSDHLEPFDFAS